MSRTTFIVICAVVVVAIAYYFRDKKLFVAVLPTSHAPNEFGPTYWKTFERLAKEVPCPPCRHGAEKFISFFHDVVNLKKGGQLFDKQNFEDTLSDINSFIQKAPPVEVSCS